MRFLVLLRGGATPKAAAEKFFHYYYCNADGDDGEEFYKIIASFLMDCFAAVKLNVTITGNDIKDSFENFQWPPESLLSYVFTYNKFTMSPVEEFLFELYIAAEEAHNNLYEMLKDSIIEDYAKEYVTPIQQLRDLIKAWIKICKHLFEKNIELIASNFEEPVARISFQLLRGVTYLRLLYKQNIFQLDQICENLLRFAQPGIKYPDLHSVVLNGLLITFKEDYHFFYEVTHSAFDFCYQILSVQGPKKSCRLIFESFIEVLQKCGNYENNTDSSVPLSVLPRGLIATRYLNAYYHFLTKGTDSRIILDILKFLNILQSKLISLDCFSEVFMEGLLSLALSRYQSISQMAVQLYVTMMQRRFDSDYILKSIVEYYFNTTNNLRMLPDYVQRLWQYFEPMQNINLHAKYLLDCSVENEFARVQLAHFVVEIFKSMLQIKGLCDMTKTFLAGLLDILKQQKGQLIQGILLEVFVVLHDSELINVVNVQDDQNSLKMIALTFEECAEHRFMDSETIQYPVLNKWFSLWNSCSSYTRNEDRLYESGLQIIAQYNEFKQEFPNFLETTNPNKNDVQRYRSLLQKLSLVIQFKQLQFEVQSDIWNDVFSGQLKGIFYDYAVKFKNFIDVYALEINFVSLLENLHKHRNKNDEVHGWLLSKVKEFELHLNSKLQNPNIIKEPMIRIKTVFFCFLQLHIIYGPNSNFKILTLPDKTYELLVRLMTHLIFEDKNLSVNFNDYDEDMLVHPLHTLQYKRSMIEELGNFHKLMGNKITSNFVWHLCIYYGLPQAKTFENDLQNLMDAIAKHNFMIYLEMLPIIIFNLCTEKFLLNRNSILNAIKAHKTFIESLKRNDTALLHLHIFITVIERLNKYVRSTEVIYERNRLLALKYLPKFIENVNLSADDGQVKKIINNKTTELSKSLLSTPERKTLNEFLKFLK